MYVADTHFGHENILKECRTQFSSVEEMNDFIINNINDKMTRADTLYIIGDFCVNSKIDPREFFDRIKPKKILIKGNHDGDWLKRFSESELSEHRLTVYDQHVIKRNKTELHLSHFPYLAWNRSHFFAQSLMVSGHIHNRRIGNLAAELFPRLRCQFNAGVDVNGFYPVTLEEMIINNRDFYEREYTDEEWDALMLSARRLTI